MTIATGALLFCIACVIATIFVLCVVIAGARADQSDLIQPIRKMNSPRQFTHHLSDNASERRGDGEGISFDHMKGNDQ